MNQLVCIRSSTAGSPDEFCQLMRRGQYESRGKHQIPRSKLQINTKPQAPSTKVNPTRRLVCQHGANAPYVPRFTMLIEVWSLVFGALFWSLDLGALPLGPLKFRPPTRV